MDRYLIAEMVVPCLIGTIAIALMFQVNTYMFLAKNYDLQNVPFMAVLQVILFRTPEYLSMTLPVGASLGASLMMSRLARESELTALRASGVPILRVIAPIALCGAVIGGLNYWIVDHVQPDWTKRSNQVAYRVGFQGSLPTVNDNVPLRLGRVSAFLGNVQRVGQQDLDIDNVLLVERPQRNRWIITTAEKGFYRSGTWTFSGARMRIMEGDKMIQAVPRDDLVIREEILVDNFSSPAVPEELSRAELRDRIALIRSSGGEARTEEIRYHTKLAIPAACLIFALISPIFAILFSRGGSFVGILLSVVLVLAYYNAFVVSTEILGKVHGIPPVACAWLPNLLFLALGLAGIRRLE